MTDVFVKALSLVRDPTIIAVLASFAVTVFVIWKLFDKQYDFLRARLDMLQKENEELRKHIELFRTENEDLRKHIDGFREENERLKLSTRQISIVVRDLQGQPEKLQAGIATIDQLGAALADAISHQKDSQKELAYMLQHALGEVTEPNYAIAKEQLALLGDLELQIRKLRPNRELAQVLQEVVVILTASQQQYAASLETPGRVVLRSSPKSPD